MKKLITILSSIMLSLSLIRCVSYGTDKQLIISQSLPEVLVCLPTDTLKPLQKIVHHAEKQSELYCVYDGSYRGMEYPGGDIERSRGVCTDVLIRSLRAGNIDLQKLIHVDMKRDLEIYNKRYKTKAIDANIDHRRTQNIQTYLTRIGGAKLDISEMSLGEFKPGDILFWDIAAGHTGIVVNAKNADNSNYLVVHNIGNGPEYEDLLSYMAPFDAYRLQEFHIKKMQAGSSYAHDFKTDPYFIDE